ncbi:uncharacterized protein LOC128207473 [Mya arenaria]|uniref:uncharacterized protein LOC128207473 n=1 Tax=Mya arenaria TaxID=6604 RepID=UPI0022DF8BF3|nr:uncharacterized protein LOC128207473 [Mya arenaria]
MSEPFSTYVSLILDQLLNDLGYSEQHIQERIHDMDKSSIARSLSAQKIQKRDDIDRIFVGSQREGIGFTFVSDLDVIQIYHFVQCLENIEVKDENKIAFYRETQSCSPGHYLLQLVHKGSNNKNFQFLEHAIIKRNGRIYLSSDLFMEENDDMFAKAEGHIGRNTVYLDRKGPSLPKFVTQSHIEKILFKMMSMPADADHTIDYVRGFPCSAYNLLKSWESRKREHEWPSLAIIKHVPSLPCFLVPVGQKRTKNQDIQWRVCFTLGELTLVRSFNNTHTKTYVVLKQIGKQILKPISQQITSFVMKNIVLWEAEKRPLEQFKPKFLCTRIKDALLFLKTCIQENRLPYYMLPDRNLLPIKFSKKDQGHLITQIDMLLEKGEENFMENLQLLDEGRAPENITNLKKKLTLGHVYTRLQICKYSVFTTQQLTNYFVQMFNLKNSAFAFLYNFCPMSIPTFWKYGKQKKDNCNTVKFGSNLHLRYTNTTQLKTNGIDNQEIIEEKTPTMVRSESSEDSGIKRDMDNSNDEIITEAYEPQYCTTKQHEDQNTDASNCLHDQSQRKPLWSPKRKKTMKGKSQRRPRKLPKDSKNKAVLQGNSDTCCEPQNQESSIYSLLYDLLMALFHILSVVYTFHLHNTNILIIFSNPTKNKSFVFLVMWLCTIVTETLNTVCTYWYGEPLSETIGTSNKSKQTLPLRHMRRGRKGRHH